jgi:hypothetical protein
MVELIARMGEMRNTYKILVGKPKRIGPLIRAREVDSRIILKWASHKG